MIRRPPRSTLFPTRRSSDLVPHRHVYGKQWIKFMKDGVNATPLPTVNTTGYIDHAAFLGTINPVELKIGRAVQQECRDRARMPSSAYKYNKTLGTCSYLYRG